VSILVLKARSLVERYSWSRFFRTTILDHEVFIEYPPEGDIRVLWTAKTYHQLLTGIQPSCAGNYNFFRNTKNLISIGKGDGEILLAKIEEILEWAKEDYKLDRVPYTKIVKIVKDIDEKKYKAFEEIERLVKAD
jgi:hypothetical protein